jgi:hypothetical protein
MAGWLGIACSIALIIALAVLGGVFGRGVGRSVRRGVGMGVGLGLMLLGLGHVIDPPAEQAIEAVENDRDDADTPSGDPDKP